MPDYEIWAPDDATMQTALTNMGLKSAKSGKSNGTIYAIDYYGTKYVQAGTDANGFFTWTPQTGVYANLRWLGATAVPPGIAGTGATIKLATPPYGNRFA